MHVIICTIKSQWCVLSWSWKLVAQRLKMMSSIRLNLQRIKISNSYNAEWQTKNGKQKSEDEPLDHYTNVLLWLFGFKIWTTVAFKLWMWKKIFMLSSNIICPCDYLTTTTIHLEDNSGGLSGHGVEVEPSLQ